MDELILSVFCEIDNFCKKFIPYMEQHCLPLDGHGFPTSLKPPSSLTFSEIMTICLVFHLSGYRTFKWYDMGPISEKYRNFFPHLVSYTALWNSCPILHYP